MYILRANYQCSLQTPLAVPHLTEYSGADHDDKLAIHWMRLPPAPDVVVGLQLRAFL